MSRPGHGVCELSDETFDAFAQLWVTRRVELGYSLEGSRRAVADGRLAAAVGAEGVVVLLVASGEQLVGFAWVADRPLSTLLDSPPVTVEDMYVDPDHRHRGAGRALLAAAADLTQREGGDQLACLASPYARHINRSLARLGFTPAATSRVVSTSALLRRLRGGSGSARDNVLLMRRRTLRARQAGGVAVAR